MNLYGAEEFAHSGDCPGCAECEAGDPADPSVPACQACIDGVPHMSCEPYFDDGSDDEATS